MLRLGLHLGLRQRNLREILVCPRGQLPSSERRLEEMKRGELRWSARDHGWEVLIPSIAFKNAHSSFFGSKPSYEQASYAIEDTPEMISKHYGRFLPQDKAAIAAKILNQVWAAA